MDPDKINVHLVAHSHDDLGWRKTFDQYFYGVNNTQDPAGIQYLWDTVIYELDKNPERKYVQVETAYLKKWYDEASQFGFLMIILIGQGSPLEGAKVHSQTNLSRIEIFCKNLLIMDNSKY